jgi:hypothetical protein
MVKGGHHTADTYEMAGSHAASVESAFDFSSRVAVAVVGEEAPYVKACALLEARSSTVAQLGDKV